VRGCVGNAVAELAAAARLRELVRAGWRKEAGGSERAWAGADRCSREACLQVSSRGAAALGGGGTAEAVAALSAALTAAEPFRARLGPGLEAAEELRAKWIQVRAAAGCPSGPPAPRPCVCKDAQRPPAAATCYGPSAVRRRLLARLCTGCPQRASAVEKLEAAVEEVRGYTADHPLSFTAPPGPACSTSGSGSGGWAEGGAGWGDDLAAWEVRVRQLEVAMAEAKDANVSVTKVRRGAHRGP
jgi:hypothetical protein